MAVYDDGGGEALYVGGYEFNAPGQPMGNVSKWDGQQWTTVGPLYDGRCTSLCVFDDGSGPGLYRTGNAFWELGYFAKLVNDDWEMVGGGITKDPYSSPWPSTHGLCVWDDALYISGYFNRAGGFQGVGGLPCGDIAAWVGSESPISIELTYVSGSPVPAGGGDLTYDVDLNNNETDPVGLDAWIDATLPNSTVITLINRALTLPGGASIARTLTLSVPAGAPAGTYTMTGNVGVYPDTVWDSSSFDFEKSGSDGVFDPGMLHLYGWDDPAETALVKNIPTEFALLGAYPNPFNPTTSIQFALPEAAQVQLTVYDVSGRQVAELVDGWRDAGAQEVTFDASSLVSGLYLFRMVAGDFNAIGKMVLSK
jgi:hypothetical protein